MMARRPLVRAFFTGFGATLIGIGVVAGIAAEGYRRLTGRGDRG